MSYNQYIYRTKRIKIVCLKTSKPGKLVETVEVIKNFDVNGKLYFKGDVVEMEVGHILSKALKRKKVELLKQEDKPNE